LATSKDGFTPGMTAAADGARVLLNLPLLWTAAAAAVMRGLML